MCLSCYRKVLRKCAKPCLFRLFLILLLTVPTAGVLANTWSFQPGLDIGEIYSDNISLAVARQAEDEFVTEVVPWFSLKNDARDLKLNLDYRLQNLLYARDNRRNNTYHQLNGQSAATLVDNLFYIDADGSIGQQLISPDTNISFDNVSITGNRINVTTYTLSPYIHHNFGTSATADVRYDYNRVDYSEADQPSSTADLYSFKLNSGPSFTRINWVVKYSEQRTYYDNFPNVTLKNSEGQLGYFVTSSLNINGSIGYDDNQFESSANTDSGRSWNVGFTWAPSPRTSLSAAYGKRFFGNNYSGDFKHRTRLTQWEASYVEEVTSVRDMQLQTRTFGLVGATGNVTLINVTFPQLTSETFVRKRAQLGMSRKLKSGALSVEFYGERRLYQTTGDREYLYGNDDSLSWDLNGRTKMTISGGWERYKYRTGNLRDDFWYAGIGATRKLSSRVSSEVQYRRSARNSTDNGADYIENRASAYVHVLF
jgi:uncharacterized protein (PEP-CTERM system associated)